MDTHGSPCRLMWKIEELLYVAEVGSIAGGHDVHVGFIIVRTTTRDVDMTAMLVLGKKVLFLECCWG